MSRGDAVNSSGNDAVNTSGDGVLNFGGSGHINVGDDVAIIEGGSGYKSIEGVDADSRSEYGGISSENDSADESYLDGLESTNSDDEANAIDSNDSDASWFEMELPKASVVLPVLDDKHVRVFGSGFLKMRRF